MKFDPLDDDLLRQRLAVPASDKRLSVVIDTDAYNEIDDQFAVVYALLAKEKLSIEAIYAAPFFNNRSSSPADGMEKSYGEIHRILGLMGATGQVPVFRGGKGYLSADGCAVPNPAAEHLVELAMSRDVDDPIYVVAIAAITNIATAILLEPRIRERIVVVWLGGHPYEWPTAWEFNLMQDMVASRLIFDCGVPLVHIPCKNVSEHLRTTLAELNAHLAGRNSLADYLCETFAGYRQDHFARSKEVWDIANVAYLAKPESLVTKLAPSPVLLDDFRWGREDVQRHLVRVAVDMDRDLVFGDLFGRVGSFEAISSKVNYGEALSV